jgi:glycosyltransferase involved in cell wall biosynthesis
MSHRPLVAIISYSLTPYRLHLHRRITRELSEIELASLFTASERASPWSTQSPPEIRPVQFGNDHDANQSRLPLAMQNSRQGGQIIRWLRDHQVQAVVLGGYYDASRLRVLRWCSRHHVPCLMFGDTNIPCDLTVGFKRWLKRMVLPQILRWSDGVLLCGSMGQKYFALYGVPPEKMFLFPYEPDYELIHSVPPAQVVAVRARYGLPPSQRLILFCGRLADQKRPDLLLDAFQTIAAERPNWGLAFAGSGPLADMLRTRQSPNLLSRIHWLGFIENHADISALYHASDVFVLPSDWEPWGVVVNEALAAGLAVVASDSVGAAAELVRDRVNGRIFPRGDRIALAECLRDVTLPQNLARYRAAAPQILTEWRKKADPIAGLRQALRFTKVLP